jgi:hypothetical protein
MILLSVPIMLTNNLGTEDEDINQDSDVQSEPDDVYSSQHYEIITSIGDA